MDNTFPFVEVKTEIDENPVDCDNLKQVQIDALCNVNVELKELVTNDISNYNHKTVKKHENSKPRCHLCGKFFRYITEL